MEITFDLKDIEEKIIKNLKNVFDPEIPTNIYDLGLIYKIEFDISYFYKVIDILNILNIYFMWNFNQDWRGAYEKKIL